MQQRPCKAQSLYYYLPSGPLQEKFADHGLGQTHNGKGSLTKIRQHHFIKSSFNILDISNTEEYFFLLMTDSAYSHLETVLIWVPVA